MATSTKKLSGGQRAITRGKIRKLQRAGLLSAKINANKKPSKYVLSQLYRFRGLTAPRPSVAAVRVSSARKAAEYRNKIGAGGRGRVVVIPREKGEKFHVTSKDEIKSTRQAYGQTISKTIGDKFLPPKEGERVYYTLPRRKRGLGSLKRRTFASFDEMLFYLTKYEIDFEDIEDYIEVERVREGSPTAKRVADEYNSAVRKLKRNKRSRFGRRGRRK